VKVRPVDFGGCPKSLNNKLKPLLFKAVDKTELSILLTSFSKEELLDYDLTQDLINTLLKSLLSVPDSVGEEGIREIDITLINVSSTYLLIQIT